MINIVGPRQTGKTTLVRDMFQAARFLTLDDDGPLSSLALDPFGQLTAVVAEVGDAGLPVVIDEVQRLPQITLALKRIGIGIAGPTVRQTFAELAENRPTG